MLCDRTVKLELDYSLDTAADGIVRELIAEAYEGSGSAVDGLLGVGIGMGGPVNPVNGPVLRAGGMPDLGRRRHPRHCSSPIFRGVPIFATTKATARPLPK